MDIQTLITSTYIGFSVEASVRIIFWLNYEHVIDDGNWWLKPNTQFLCVYIVKTIRKEGL